MKYMGAYGTCKFCGNPRFVSKAPTDASQDEIDAIATDECDCDRARQERTVRELIGKTSTSIARIVTKHSEETASLFEMGTEAVARGRIDKITSVCGLDTYEMFRKAGKIIVKRTRKEISFADGELEDGPVKTSTQSGIQRKLHDLETAQEAAQ